MCCCHNPTTRTSTGFCFLQCTHIFRMNTFRAPSTDCMYAHQIDVFEDLSRSFRSHTVRKSFGISALTIETNDKSSRSNGVLSMTFHQRRAFKSKQNLRRSHTNSPTQTKPIPRSLHRSHRSNFGVKRSNYEGIAMPGTSMPTKTSTPFVTALPDRTSMASLGTNRFVFTPECCEAIVMRESS
jgi:hypothetical protein